MPGPRRTAHPRRHPTRKKRQARRRLCWPRGAALLTCAPRCSRPGPTRPSGSSNKATPPSTARPGMATRTCAKCSFGRPVGPRCSYPRAKAVCGPGPSRCTKATAASPGGSGIVRPGRGGGSGGSTSGRCEKPSGIARNSAPPSESSFSRPGSEGKPSQSWRFCQGEALPPPTTSRRQCAAWPWTRPFMDCAPALPPSTRIRRGNSGQSRAPAIWLSP
mmetsp:Transcript_17135/g.39487  ORF Transcript_17135/g.39487 Transcript_17135/m.39487 type:complete len:218 (+) Transcript_17135:1937-2590(+)